MGKYLSNCNEVVGVRTRAKTRASATALSSSSMAVKKMKKGSSNARDLRNRRKIAVISDDNFRREKVVINSSFHSLSPEVEARVDCTGGDDVSIEFQPSSCFSSNDNDNASTSNMMMIIVDPEVESAETTPSIHLKLDYDNNKERRESEVESVESEKMDTPMMRSRLRKSTVQIKKPLDSEIDAFFAAAEKNLQKRFADRYNFDVVKEVPLEGRYEWMPIKPLNSN